MITTILIIEAFAVYLLVRMNLIANPYSLFPAVAVVTVLIVFISRNKLRCPFVKMRSFNICPLNKKI